MARLGGGWGRVPPDQKGDGVNLLGGARTRPGYAGYAWSAVVHRERGGGAHAHVLAAPVRPRRPAGASASHRRAGGRRSTPCGDAFNAEHGWSRPDDPERARVEQPGHRAYIEAARLRAGLGLETSPRRPDSGLPAPALSSTARCGTGPMSSPSCGRRAWKVPRQGGRIGQRRTGSTHGAEGDGIRTHAGRCPHDLSRRPSPTVNDHVPPDSRSFAGSGNSCI